MNAAKTLLSVSLWILILAPTACALDVLSHACPEDLSPVCGHESDCNFDPCNVQLIPGRSTHEGKDSDDQPFTDIMAASGQTGLASAGPIQREPYPAGPVPGRPCLPVPAEALPLLC